MEGCHLFPHLLLWPEEGLREHKPKLSQKPGVAIYLRPCPESVVSAFILSFLSLSAFLKGIYFTEMQFVYPGIHSSVHLNRFSKHRKLCSHYHNLNLEFSHGASREASPLCICSPLWSPPEVPASKTHFSIYIVIWTFLSANLATLAAGVF